MREWWVYTRCRMMSTLSGCGTNVASSSATNAGSAAISSVSSAWIMNSKRRIPCAIEIDAYGRSGSAPTSLLGWPSGSLARSITTQRVDDVVPSNGTPIRCRVALRPPSQPTT